MFTAKVVCTCATGPNVSSGPFQDAVNMTLTHCQTCIPLIALSGTMSPELVTQLKSMKQASEQSCLCTQMHERSFMKRKHLQGPLTCAISINNVFAHAYGLSMYAPHSTFNADKLYASAGRCNMQGVRKD